MIRSHFQFTTKFKHVVKIRMKCHTSFLPSVVMSRGFVFASSYCGEWNMVCLGFVISMAWHGMQVRDTKSRGLFAFV